MNAAKKFAYFFFYPELDDNRPLYTSENRHAEVIFGPNRYCIYFLPNSDSKYTMLEPVLDRTDPLYIFAEC